MEYGHVRGFGRLSMLTTGKVAAVLGIHPDTIRNYEKKGIFPTAKRSPVNGYRLWATEDLALMKEILQLPDQSTLSPLTLIEAHSQTLGLLPMGQA
jgi:hypothetical protein